VSKEAQAIDEILKKNQVANSAMGFFLLTMGAGFCIAGIFGVVNRRVMYLPDVVAISFGMIFILFGVYFRKKFRSRV